MMRNWMQMLSAVAVALILLSACSNMSVQGDGSTVTATASGSTLFYEVEELIDETHTVLEHSCTFRKPKARPARADTHKPLILLEPATDLLNDLNELVKAGKSVIDLFPSHTYSAAAKCG